MADYNQTISNTMGLFGGSETEMWGVMVWGVDNWGDSGELRTTVTKGISAGSIGLSDSIGKTPKIGVVNSLVTVGDMYLERLDDGSGYSYVFTGNTTDAESRVATAYTADTDAATEYTAESDVGTDWEES